MSRTETVDGVATGVPKRTEEVVASPVTGTGIRRLDPVDGLFLRAEHLTAIQDHAATLDRLTAAAGGSGVVYGYTLDLSGV